MTDLAKRLENIINKDWPEEVLRRAIIKLIVELKQCDPVLPNNHQPRKSAER